LPELTIGYIVCLVSTGQWKKSNILLIQPNCHNTVDYMEGLYETRLQTAQPQLNSEEWPIIIKVSTKQRHCLITEWDLRPLSAGFSHQYTTDLPLNK